jgi:hypothetical protein
VTLTLHLGVVDVPYAQPAPGAVGHNKPPGSQTTGDVAEWLEAKYHVMEIFAELHKDDIDEALADSAAGALENLLMGSPVGADAFGAGQSKIEDAFRKFIDTKEMERLGYPGVPTKAALKGVNHRLKRKRGPSRPSFQDTGLYEANFAAWVD